MMPKRSGNLVLLHHFQGASDPEYDLIKLKVSERFRSFRCFPPPTPTPLPCPNIFSISEQLLTVATLEKERDGERPISSLTFLWSERCFIKVLQENLRSLLCSSAQLSLVKVDTAIGSGQCFKLGRTELRCSICVLTKRLSCSLSEMPLCQLKPIQLCC